MKGQVVKLQTIEKVQEQLSQLRRKAADQLGPAAPTDLANNRIDQPETQNPQVNTRNRQAQAPPSQDRPRRRFDLDMGGGAIDPITAA